jgi:uncharacterized protein
MEARQYKVIRKVRETPNTVSIFLSAADDAALDPFHAGQHLAFDIPSVGERKYVLSAFSLQPKVYRITVVHGDEQDTPRGSHYWTREVSAGDLVQARGPSGVFGLPATLERPILILSKDIGEAAWTAIAEELAVRAPLHRAVFLHSTFNSSTFALKGKLGSLKADMPNATWKILFSNPRQADRQGKEYDLFGELDLRNCANLFPLEEFDAYICGPEDFVASTEATLLGLKTHCRQMFKENMGATIEPPIEIAQQEKLPPLEPRTVTFARAGIKATWTPERGTLLELAEHLGVKAPFSCRTGMCGKCAQKVISGEVTKIRQTYAQTLEHHQLLCSNIPLSDLEIDL